MKFLIDNNLSFKLVGPLQSHFPGTTHVRSELTVLAADISIWNYAKSNNYIILTKDNDFDNRSQLEGCPPKVVQLICGNTSTVYILDLLFNIRGEIHQFGESDDDNCILKIP